MEIPYIPREILRKFINDHLFSEDGMNFTPEYQAFCDQIDCANYSGHDSGACFILGWSVEETTDALVALDEEAEDEFDDDNYDEYGDCDSDRIHFANPGSNSALRAATADNPRDRPCPTCERPNLLTREDVRLGYCCDSCADKAEKGWD